MIGAPVALWLVPALRKKTVELFAAGGGGQAEQSTAIFSYFTFHFTFIVKIMNVLLKFA
jgi:hypothetical protein